MLEHGGRLVEAGLQYGISPENWLDLSTGIHPVGWQPPALPNDIWRALPEDDDGLAQAADHYYGVNHGLPIAGSQAAIQVLPLLRKPGRVVMLDTAYAEHAHHWQRAGHQLHQLPYDCSDQHITSAVASADVLLLIHPNNPTGRRYSRQQLMHWHAILRERGGWLVIDEAYIDSDPSASLVSQTEQSGLIVLRSVGKFFGLAGARVGFFFAEQAVRDELQERLGPWPISCASRWVVTKALLDSRWQRQQRQWLECQRSRLFDLLLTHDLAPSGGCSLYQWCLLDEAWLLHQRLAQRGIFTRFFAEPASLRFGLPANEQQWQYLSQVLAEIKGKS